MPRKMQKDKNAIALNYHPDINSSDSVHDNANGLNVPLNGQAGSTEDRGSSRRRSSAVVTLFTKINKAKKSSTLNIIKQLKATKDFSHRGGVLYNVLVPLLRDFPYQSVL